MRKAIMAAALLALAATGAWAQSGLDGYNSGYGDARRSADIFASPGNLLPEPSDSTPAFIDPTSDLSRELDRQKEWRSHYRDGYGAGQRDTESENMFRCGTLDRSGCY